MPQKHNSPKSQRGFTLIEIMLLVVIIGILLGVIVSLQTGVRQNSRNTERERDIKELRDVMEIYYSQNDKYPTLADINSNTWRATNMKGLEQEVLRDPKGASFVLVDSPAKNVYAYVATSASGSACNNKKTPCTQYTLTAMLEGGGTYVKNNLN